MIRTETRSAQHWRNVHLAGDKNPPINLPDRRRRLSVGTATKIRTRGKNAEIVYE